MRRDMMKLEDVAPGDIQMIESKLMEIAVGGRWCVDLNVSTAWIFGRAPGELTLAHLTHSSRAAKETIDTVFRAD